MTIELNHIIVPANDARASAKFLADILGVKVSLEWGHFVPVKTQNGVTLDFEQAKNFRPHDCAFLVSEAEFDAALVRLKKSGAAFYANHRREHRGEINHLSRSQRM